MSTQVLEWRAARHGCALRRWSPLRGGSPGAVGRTGLAAARCWRLLGKRVTSDRITPVLRSIPVDGDTTREPKIDSRVCVTEHVST